MKINGQKLETDVEIIEEMMENDFMFMDQYIFKI